MKLNFKPSKSSKSKSFQLNSTDKSTSTTQPEFICEFDPSKNLTLNSAPNRSRIIPPKQNEYQIGNKMNLDFPPLRSTSSVDFEVIKNVSLKDESMSYGLNLRGVVVNCKANASETFELVMLRKFKSDIERLPDEQEVDMYVDIPVEGFGAALLAGYGWNEGMGIGRNAKADVKVVKYKRHSAKEGIGFIA